MPGPPASAPDWGELPLVVDTSAFARAGHRAVRDRWREAILEDRLRLSPVARLEILLSAQDGEAFDGVAELLSAIRPAPLTPSVVRAAEYAMRELSQRSAGAHRMPIVDYLLAAAAQQLGAAVIHYDRDYDVLAEILSFESIWLATPGSIP